MKKIVYNLSFCSIVLLVFIFSFCSRQNEEEFLPQANIQITSPAENALVRYGETLLIRGTATGTKELHGYEIEIRKQGGSSLYYQHNKKASNLF
jgi:hypothetical protein